jgi:hypothetical protein
VLFLNVSAGIGMIGMASPMLQEVFAGSLIGRPDISFTHLNDEQRRMVATIGTLVLTVFGPFGLLPSRRDDGFSRSIQEPVAASPPRICRMSLGQSSGRLPN